MNKTGTILLADSNEDDVLILQNALRDAGLTQNAIVLRDGVQALAYLGGEAGYADRSLFPPPRLLVMDRHLHLRDATEILEWLDRHPEARKGMTVLILSAAEDLSAGERFRELGAEAFLVKPFRYEDLVAMVVEWKKYLPG
jgi:CheY-like chemotaxis protein